MSFGSVTGERDTEGCPLGQSCIMERGNDGCQSEGKWGNMVTREKATRRQTGKVVRMIMEGTNTGFEHWLTRKMRKRPNRS